MIIYSSKKKIAQYKERPCSVNFNQVLTKCLCTTERKRHQEIIKTKPFTTSHHYLTAPLRHPHNTNLPKHLFHHMTAVYNKFTSYQSADKDPPPRPLSPFARAAQKDSRTSEGEYDTGTRARRFDSGRFRIRVCKDWGESLGGYGFFWGGGKAWRGEQGFVGLFVCVWEREGEGVHPMEGVVGKSSSVKSWWLQFFPSPPPPPKTFFSERG